MAVGYRKFTSEFHENQEVFRKMIKMDRESLYSNFTPDP